MQQCLLHFLQFESNFDRVLRPWHAACNRQGGGSQTYSETTEPYTTLPVLPLGRPAEGGFALQSLHSCMVGCRGNWAAAGGAAGAGGANKTALSSLYLQLTATTHNDAVLSNCLSINPTDEQGGNAGAWRF